jgi:CIC family chloride channel protein
LLQSSRVRDLMTEDFQLIKQDTRLRGIRNRLQTAPHGDFFVVDEEDRLIGTLSFADVRPVAFEPGVEDLIIAYDLARLHSLMLEADSNLEEALRTLGESSATRVPVVEDLKSRRVVGVARYRDLLRAHNRILMQARAEERGEA